MRPSARSAPVPGHRDAPRRRRRRRRRSWATPARSGCAAQRVQRLLERSRGHRARRSPPTAGCAPATSAWSTTTATLPGRPDQGPDHRVGLQRVPGRGRGGAARAPGRRGAAVVGVPHPHTGEAVKAYVVLERRVSLEEDDIIDFCTDRLARYKCPTKVSSSTTCPRACPARSSGGNCGVLTPVRPAAIRCRFAGTDSPAPFRHQRFAVVGAIRRSAGGRFARGAASPGTDGRGAAVPGRRRSPWGGPRRRVATAPTPAGSRRTSRRGRPTAPGRTRSRRSR